MRWLYMHQEESDQLFSSLEYAAAAASLGHTLAFLQMVLEYDADFPLSTS